MGSAPMTQHTDRPSNHSLDAKARDERAAMAASGLGPPVRSIDPTSPPDTDTPSKINSRREDQPTTDLNRQG